jgi:hypothetical protein
MNNQLSYFYLNNLAVEDLILLKYENGDTYFGEINDNNIIKKGVYTWNDTSTYTGMFINNNLTGNGIFVHANGNKFEGKLILYYF